MTPIIQVVGLKKSFNGKTVLDDINLEIGQGEELSIVGGSGCGKTVLAKHFNGLLRPDAGKVVVLGKDTSQASDDDLDEIRRRIGYVFQGNALFVSDISTDVYGNVSLPLRDDPYSFPAKDESEIRKRVAEVLTEVGLSPEYMDRNPDDLSGGEKKRVAVARAIAAKPPVVIYDEPTTGLDPEHAEIIIELIDNLHRNNQITTIAITHEKKLMKRLRRLIFLKNRKIYYDGNREGFFHSEDPEIVKFLAQTEGSRARPETFDLTA